MRGRLQPLASAHLARQVGLLADAIQVPAAAAPARLYRRLLHALQGDPLLAGGAPGPALHFQGDALAATAVARILAHHGAPSAFRPFAAAERADIQAAVDRALDTLRRVDAPAHRAFRLLVQALVVVRLPSFGSRSDALGVVVAGIDPAWPALELAELLWHEAVHQALFLEDMLDPLFQSDDDPQSPAGRRVHNPLLGEDRPLEPAFHGMVVSAVLAELHLKAGSLARSAVLAEAAAGALACWGPARHHLTGHGAALLDALARRLRGCLQALHRQGAPGLPGEAAVRRSYLALQPSWLRDHADRLAGPG